MFGKLVSEERDRRKPKLSLGGTAIELNFVSLQQL
jgi:hypothetical protein